MVTHVLDAHIESLSYQVGGCLGFLIDYLAPNTYRITRKNTNR